MTDFMGWRFGAVAQWYFLSLVLFNMSIVALSELTTGAPACWRSACNVGRCRRACQPARSALTPLPPLRARPPPLAVPAAGSLFQDYVGSEAWIIILVIGALSLTYTAVGGLVVSIITDQLQGEWG